jgi:hypothetical protein
MVKNDSRLFVFWSDGGPVDWWTGLGLVGGPEAKVLCFSQKSKLTHLN